MEMPSTSAVNSLLQRRLAVLVMPESYPYRARTPMPVPRTRVDGGAWVNPVDGHPEEFRCSGDLAP